MADILEEIIAHKQVELKKMKEILPLHDLAERVDYLLENCPNTKLSMRQSLAESSSGIIAEFKRRSPSKGWIKEEGEPTVIPPSYAENGAAALSILTDEKFFGGKLNFIQKARPLVPGTPILRKDFIIDEYQLYQAYHVGANAVLLIAACLSKRKCRELARKAHALSMETLLEVHSESELEYVSDNIDMVGVNNRNLGTFHTDVQNSFRLANMLPQDYLLVSESGISHPHTVKELRQAGFRGFLIGETFMKSTHPGLALKEFIQQI